MFAWLGEGDQETVGQREKGNKGSKENRTKRSRKER